MFNNIFKMKHLRFLFFALFICVFTCSCDGLGKKQQKKIYTPDITIKKVSGMNYAYYQGELFSGDVFSSDEKSMMAIKNGIAVVAYANYGQSGNIASENQLEIHEDLSTIEQHQAKASYTNGQRISLASAIYDELKIRTLRSLPNCSFSH